MATELSFTIQEIVAGMERINEEKKEIKLILLLLLPYMLITADKRWGFSEPNHQELSPWENLISFFSASLPSGEGLMFKARLVSSQIATPRVMEFTVLYRDVGRNLFAIASGVKAAPEVIRPERLSTKDTGICHAILKDLIVKVAEEYPELTERIAIFQAAAKR